MGDEHITRAAPTQKQVLDWVRAQWPDRATPIWRAAKLGEEAGEVIGAVIKMDEGRKTAADVEQETAQVVICAMAVAESVGFDLAAAVAAECERVWNPAAGAVGDVTPPPDEAFRAVGRIRDSPLMLGVQWLPGVDYETDPDLDDGVVLYVKSAARGLVLPELPETLREMEQRPDG